MGNRNILYVFFIVLLLFSLVGCSKTSIQLDDLPKPPELNVLFQNQSFDAVCGTYTWKTVNNDGSGSAIFADAGTPPELVKNSIPLTVSPKSLLTLKFSDIQPSSFYINIWEDNTIIKQELSNNQLVVPNSKGLIIYEVAATWEQGTAYYAFLVEVE